MSKNVVFDFDGVIHSYKSGWQGYDVISDPPVEGIKEAICAIRDAGYRVYVVSSRCASTLGLETVQDWLKKYGIYVDGVCQEKPPAIAYIDDRAICFDGDAKSLLEKIENFEPWYKMKDTPVDKSEQGKDMNLKSDDTHESIKRSFLVNLDLDTAIHGNIELLKGLIVEADFCRSIKKKQKYIDMVADTVYNLLTMIKAQRVYTQMFKEDK